VSKIVIDSYALGKIKELALNVFKETHHLPEDAKEAQVFLVLNGFASYLHSIGIVPNFTVKPVREENNDSTPLDDLG
jgi:hypothetical protein